MPRSRENRAMRITYKFDYQISRTMAFEKEYHPNLRFTLPEKTSLLRKAIVIWMFVDGKLAGETYGIPVMQMGVNERPEGTPPDSEAIYCYSNTILGKFKGKGFGTILKATFLGRASAQFRRVYGHARPGASQALNKKFGARMLATHKNWYRTGEDYRLYVLEIYGDKRKKS